MARNAALALACVVTSPAAADFDAASYPPYERCALCHGLFGVSANARFPNLGGQDPAYLDRQIRAFLSGARHNDNGQMAAVVTELQPDDIAVVVDWFSTQDPPAPAPAPDTAAGQGAPLYARAGCGACHDAAPDMAGVPKLRAQHAGYLAKQMRDFRDGRRRSGQLDVPHGAILPAGDAEIDAIAHYLAAQPRP